VGGKQKRYEDYDAIT